MVPASVRTEEEKKVVQEELPKQKRKPTDYQPSRDDTKKQLKTSDQDEEDNQSEKEITSVQKQEEKKEETIEKSESQLVKDIKEVDASRNSKSNNVPSNNQKDQVDQSITSEKFTVVANDYIGGVFDKVMDDYTNLVKSKEDESATDPTPESTSRNPPVNQDLSIERRVNMDSSIEQNDNESIVHNNQDDEPVSDHNKSTSTIRNMANDYVSNMIQGLY